MEMEITESSIHVPDQVSIFFFPFVGAGHQIPMIDMARVFASHGAKTTILATPNQAAFFQDSIARDQKVSNLPISIQTLLLQETIEPRNADVTSSPLTDTSMLQEPLNDLLSKQKPHCIVYDVFHQWAVDVIDRSGVPRIAFSGNGCFPNCVEYKMLELQPQEDVKSEHEPFVVPGLPHRIEMTRSQLPSFMQPGSVTPRSPVSKGNIIAAADEKLMGVVVNSFYDLEGAYSDQFSSHMRNKSWLAGPVSLFNRDIAGRSERGKRSSVNEKSILSWLDAKASESVLYVGFGSWTRMAPLQLEEIATGLENSDCNFIWAVLESVAALLPERFEERVEGRGLVIRGWAPQLLILEHPSVGCFMTHCGWNSILEGVTSGVPMITWPYSADQFINEKLVTDVMQVGIKVGNLQWNSSTQEQRSIVGREKVEASVRRMMAGGEDVQGMRRRARELREKSCRAVETGGSSFKDIDELINELKHRTNDPMEVSSLERFIVHEL